MVVSISSVALVIVLFFSNGEVYEAPIEQYSNWRDCIVRSMDVASVYKRSPNVLKYKVQCIPVTRS